MFRQLEAIGERLLELIVPGATAAAACPPEYWCSACSNPCYVKKCRVTPTCGTACGSCGYYCSASTGAAPSALC